MTRSAAATAHAVDPEPDVKRLSLSLSGTVYNELTALAKSRRTTMTEVVRLALGLVKIAVQENKLGHKLVICTAEGQPLREIVMP